MNVKNKITSQKNVKCDSYGKSLFLDINVFLVIKSIHQIIKIIFNNKVQILRTYQNYRLQISKMQIKIFTITLIQAFN